MSRKKESLLALFLIGLNDMHAGTNLDAFIKIDHVFIGQTDAA